MKIYQAETFYKIKRTMELTPGDGGAPGSRQTADYLRKAIVKEAAGGPFLILADRRFLSFDPYVDMLCKLSGQFAVCVLGESARVGVKDGSGTFSEIRNKRIKIYYRDYEEEEKEEDGLFHELLAEYATVFDLLNLTGPADDAAETVSLLRKFAGNDSGHGLPFIAALNESGRRVVAAGFPFGADPASGELPMGYAVRADATIPIPGPFTCHFIFPGCIPAGYDRSPFGCTSVSDDSLSGQDTANDPSIEYLSQDESAELVPCIAGDHDPFGSKYTNGRVFVIAGSHKYPGAALLTVNASQRCGVGFTEIAVPGCLSDVIPSVCPEALRIPLGGRAVKYIKYKHVGRLLYASRKADSVAIGPGLGREKETVEAVIAFLLHTSAKKLVVDADALFAISILLRKKQGGELVKKIFRDKEAVITPHAGEAAYLLGESIEYTTFKRLETAKRLHDLTGAVVLLKGRDTVTYLSDKRFTVNGTGNPALAKGGSGDVLAGVIGALLAKGHDGYDAARFGAYIHGLSADIAAAKLGINGMLPGDLTMELKDLL